MASKFLRYKDLKEKYGIPFSRRHLDRLEAVGEFPKRARLSKYLVLWDEDEVVAYRSKKLKDRELDITV